MKILEHLVYLDNEDIILEVKRNNGFSIYFIENNGSFQKISDSKTKYIPTNGVISNPYYIDFVSIQVIETINLITKGFNYDQVIAKLKFLLITIVPDKYEYLDFSMQIAYIFEDYLDCLKQLSIFLDEVEYLEKIKECSSFFDEYFYNKKTNLTINDFEEINIFLTKQIIFLESLKSN